MLTISEGLGELGITINHSHITQMEKLAIHFTLRKTHPLTFGGPYLGIDPIAFTPSDYNALFDVFEVHRKDVELKIREISSIDRNFIVTSDPFNILCIWLCHLAPIYIRDKRVCREFTANVLRYFHYRIFCSVVNNSFPHGSNPGVMEATVASLTRKSTIVKLETWNNVIESHVEKMMDPNDKSYKTMIDGFPDDMFLRVISDSQTALRSKIVIFAGAYYETHAAGDSIGSVSSVSQNSEGEKIIAQTASVVDSATSLMISELLNPKMFVHEISVNDISKQFTNVSPRMLKTALLKINETAVLQVSSRSFDKTIKDSEGTLFIGMRALTIDIIISMIRMCRSKRVNLGNRSMVFETMRNAYSSSRNLDPDILNIKRSVAHLVDAFNITTNEASKSALRLAVIYYFIYRVIQKMKV